VTRRDEQTRPVPRLPLINLGLLMAPARVRSLSRGPTGPTREVRASTIKSSAQHSQPEGGPNAALTEPSCHVTGARETRDMQRTLSVPFQPVASRAGFLPVSCQPPSRPTASTWGRTRGNTLVADTSPGRGRRSATSYVHLDRHDGALAVERPRRT
jgi:hypothetical protein